MEKLTIEDIEYSYSFGGEFQHDYYVFDTRNNKLLTHFHYDIECGENPSSFESDLADFIHYYNLGLYEGKGA